MKHLGLLASAALFVVVTGCNYNTGRAPTSQERADRLARGVTLAAGAPALPAVEAITFTYVEREGDAVKLRRRHVWDLKNNTDTMTVGDQSTTIKLDEPDANPEAYKAFANDTFWLTAPLRLLDENLVRDHLGTRELRGRGYEVLQISSTKSGEVYNLYVDPLTSLVAYWEDLSADAPAPATWEQYRHFGGLRLATRHDLGPRTIAMEAITVQSQP